MAFRELHIMKAHSSNFRGAQRRMALGLVESILRRPRRREPFEFNGQYDVTACSSNDCASIEYRKGTPENPSSDQV